VPTARKVLPRSTASIDQRRLTLRRLGQAQTFPTQKSSHRVASISKQGTDPDKIGPSDDHSKFRVAQRSGQWLDHPQALDQT
jgi:hypothetical protein